MTESSTTTAAAAMPSATDIHALGRDREESARLQRSPKSCGPTAPRCWTGPASEQCWPAHTQGQDSGSALVRMPALGPGPDFGGIAPWPGDIRDVAGRLCLGRWRPLRIAAGRLPAARSPGHGDVRQLIRRGADDD